MYSRRFIFGLCLVFYLLLPKPGKAWGFFAHKKINYYAVFLLPPEMLLLYKPEIDFLSSHAVDPDMRRYAVAAEAPRHYIDMDYYRGDTSWKIPRQWDSAVAVYSADTLQKNGIVPWWIQIMLARLTTAFREKNRPAILKLSAEIGHYIADAHVPLHASSNHDGQLTNQKGIHGFWESRIPELFAEQQYDFFIGKALFISKPLSFTWERVVESALASDTVLDNESTLNQSFAQDKKFAFEERNGKILRQYSTSYSTAYQAILKGMVERRMQQAILAVASFWFTAWLNAGQPDLSNLSGNSFTSEDLAAFRELEYNWKNVKPIGRDMGEHVPVP